RPGLWNVLSGPKFPYGKRQMALPIWAYRRGKTYDAVVMNYDPLPGETTHEGWIGFNEGYSSPEDYFCRPLNQSDITGSIVTPNPASSIFCPAHWSSCLSRTASPEDVAVAAATPPYGQPYSGVWYIPTDLPPGDYAVWVEVNKEFDTNAFHDHPAVG